MLSKNGTHILKKRNAANATKQPRSKDQLRAIIKQGAYAKFMEDQAKMRSMMLNQPDEHTYVSEATTMPEMNHPYMNMTTAVPQINKLKMKSSL